MSIRATYIEKMKLQLDELNTTMDELQTKADNAKIEFQEKYLKEMTSLREQSQVALDRLDELKTSGEESWESMVTEAEKVRDAFVQSFHYFKSQL
jgi:TolA-binding protein